MVISGAMNIDLHLHTGSNDRHLGVGFLMNKQWDKNRMIYYQCTKRIIMIKPNTSLTTTTIIQVYMPTTAHDND